MAGVDVVAEDRQFGMPALRLSNAGTQALFEGQRQIEYRRDQEHRVLLFLRHAGKRNIQIDQGLSIHRGQTIVAHGNHFDSRRGTDYRRATCRQRFGSGPSAIELLAALHQEKKGRAPRLFDHAQGELLAPSRPPTRPFCTMLASTSTIARLASKEVISEMS